MTQNKSNANYITFEITQSFCQNISSEESSFKSIYNLHNYISLTLAPLNILLNSISLKVFMHSLWKNSSISYILKGLSILEICFSVCLLLQTISSALLDQFYSTSGTENVFSTLLDLSKLQIFAKVLLTLHPILSACLFAFQISRNWFVVLLAAYRYDMICRKIGTLSAFPRQRIPAIMGVNLCLACLISLPRIFEVHIYFCESNAKVYKVELYFAANRIYHLVYIGIITFIVQSGGPVICVCVLSFFVVRQIWMRQKYWKVYKKPKLALPLPDVGHINRSLRNLLNRHSPVTVKQKPAGDRMILTLCFTFFFLETPAFFSKILNTYLSKSYPVHDVYISVFANILIYLDSTFNFFVYMASNPTFRRVGRLMLTRTSTTLENSRRSRNSTKLYLNGHIRTKVDGNQITNYSQI